MNNADMENAAMEVVIPKVANTEAGLQELQICIHLNLDQMIRID